MFRSEQPPTPSEERLLALGDAYRPAGDGDQKWKGRVVKGIMALLFVALVAGASTGGYALWRYSQIHKLDLAQFLTRVAPDQPQTFLVVGSDTRSGLEPGQKKQFGSGSAVAGQRSDTIMLVRIDPQHSHAAILSLPRDLYVTIAGSGRQDRINSAFDNGAGPLITTINQNFGINVDHYVEVNFDSFRSIVNTIHGVQVNFPTPVRDFDPATGQNLSGLSIPRAGCINLTGNQALSYVRSRHYQIFDKGRWQSDPESDLGRIQRQQDFVRRMVHKAVQEASSNPLTLNSLIASGVKNLKVDKGLGLTDMTRLATRFKSIDPANIQSFTMPAKPIVVDGADVLEPEPAQDATAIQQFMDAGITQPASTATPATTPTTTSASKFVPPTNNYSC